MITANGLHHAVKRPELEYAVNISFAQDSVVIAQKDGTLTVQGSIDEVPRVWKLMYDPNFDSLVVQEDFVAYIRSCDKQLVIEKSKPGSNLQIDSDLRMRKKGDKVIMPKLERRLNDEGQEDYVLFATRNWLYRADKKTLLEVDCLGPNVSSFICDVNDSVFIDISDPLDRSHIRNIEKSKQLSWKFTGERLLAVYECVDCWGDPLLLTLHADFRGMPPQTVSTVWETPLRPSDSFTVGHFNTRKEKQFMVYRTGFDYWVTPFPSTPILDPGKIGRKPVDIPALVDFDFECQKVIFITFHDDPEDPHLHEMNEEFPL
jgi:hypothetical protein